MDLKFSEMAVDTTLAQEYLEKNELLPELYNDYNGTIDKYSNKGEDFLLLPKNINVEIYEEDKDPQTVFTDIASKLKQNATLIAQLEYHIRNIPIEETHAQLNLLIQYFRSCSLPRPECADLMCRPDEPLLALEYKIARSFGKLMFESKTPVAICHLLATLQREAGFPVQLQLFKETEDTSNTPDLYLEDNWYKGMDTGTVAVVSEDADVDSAVDKFISVSKQAPWRLRRILVQESVYQEFKEALTWKCKLNKSGSKAPTRNVLCSDTLTYNDRTFLIDPVELIEEKRSVVTVEAYRTTKEMISLVQQYKAHYLSLWINGVAEINEVTHSTMAPVVWVNTVADFRGRPQVSHAVFPQCMLDITMKIKKCDKVTKLCELSKSWLKLDFESRRDILCGVLDEYLSLDPENKLYIDIKHSISSCTQKSFVDLGKDYVCIGMLQPKGIMAIYENSYFSVKGFESILHGNALIVISESRRPHYTTGLPVVTVDKLALGDLEVPRWISSGFVQNRVIWTNSGTIFAN